MALITPPASLLLDHHPLSAHGDPGVMHAGIVNLLLAAAGVRYGMTGVLYDLAP